MIDTLATALEVSVSTHPNVALMRAMYDAHTAGDLASLSERALDDFAFHFPGRSPLAGVYHGLPEVIKLFTRQFELTGGDFQVIPQKILADDETGIALIRVSGTRGTRQLDVPGVNVVRFQDGKLAEYCSYTYDQYAVDEFWSEL
jgi:ketosteroid isomerase-like protein